MAGLFGANYRSDEIHERLPNFFQILPQDHPLARNSKWVDQALWQQLSSIGHKGRTEWRTGGRRRISLHETHSVFRQPIHIRRFVDRVLVMLNTVVARRIHPPEIVGQNVQNIRFRKRVISRLSVQHRDMVKNNRDVVIRFTAVIPRALFMSSPA